MADAIFTVFSFGCCAGEVNPDVVQGDVEKATGTARSNRRSPERVWSARVTTEQEVRRQSVSPITGDTVMRTSNLPPARYGMASERP
jgi:hypothetical protein